MSCMVASQGLLDRRVVAYSAADFVYVWTGQIHACTQETNIHVELAKYINVKVLNV